MIEKKYKQEQMNIILLEVNRYINFLEIVFIEEELPENSKDKIRQAYRFYVENLKQRSETLKW